MNDQASADSKELRKGPPSVKSWLWGLAIIWVVLLVVERIASGTDASRIFSNSLGQGIAVLIAGILGFFVWKARDFLWKSLPTIDFSIAIMGTLTLATMLGTIIVQDQGRDRLTEIHGATPAAFIIGLGLDHIFHSYWFGAFVLLFAGALCMVVVKRRMWEVPKLGFLMAHLGVVIIIIGGFIAYFFGFKGSMDLNEGKSSNQVRSLEATGGVRKVVELPFAILLEDFDIEWYPGGHRFYVYERAGDKYKVVSSTEPQDASAWQKLPGAMEFRVKEAFPDYVGETKLVESPPGDGDPALVLSLGMGGHVHEVPVFAQTLSAAPMPMMGGLPALRFVWAPPTDEELAPLGQSGGSPLAVSFDLDGKTENVAVEVGQTYELAQGAYVLKVLDYQPDFVYDMDTKTAGSRSDQPNNPALRVAVGPKGQEAPPNWLFANNPDVSMMHGRTDELRLRFVFSASRTVAPREIIVVGQSRELIELAEGKVISRGPLGPEADGIPQLKAAAYRIMESARERTIHSSKSGQWNHPLVIVELKRDGKIEEREMQAEHSKPIALPDGKSFLVFEGKEPEAKSYRSQLAVTAGERKVKEQLIAVNNPLSYGGWKFYQSNYRKEDPTYSGLLAVRDPGLWIVYLGFIMISAGVIFAAYVRPRILKRRKGDA